MSTATPSPFDMDCCVACFRHLNYCTCPPPDDDGEEDWDDDPDDDCEEVWCPEFRHRTGITERNSGVCRHCVSEGFQEAPADA